MAEYLNRVQEVLARVDALDLGPQQQWGSLMVEDLLARKEGTGKDDTPMMRLLGDVQCHMQVLGNLCRIGNGQVVCLLLFFPPFLFLPFSALFASRGFFFWPRRLFFRILVWAWYF